MSAYQVDRLSAFQMSKYDPLSMSGCRVVVMFEFGMCLLSSSTKKCHVRIQSCKPLVLLSIIKLINRPNNCARGTHL